MIKRIKGASKIRRLATYGASLGIAVGSLVAMPGTATAASSVASYNGVCGSGYALIDSVGLGGEAVVYLTYNSGNGKNCAVTLRNAVGAPELMDVVLRRSGDDASTVWDSGNYTSYAGPVYLYAQGSCIDWGGLFRKRVTMGNSHCG
ncbi:MULTISPECIES: hypothetical protein [unclassified Streptomyces]|uniref:hypothetical protein n=1 Tax=unclassified Streptomyces TaxID=2593676 RepID=UPI00093CA9FF|nr:hypothetical protein [Streptomyces sp. TSRI0281]